MNDLAHLLATAETWLADDRRVGMAIVAQTWGSAPRPAGSRLIFDTTGAFEGSVSGGCIEGAVLQAGVEMLLENRPPRVLEFSVSDESAWSVGLTCGGRINVLICRLDNRNWIRQVRQAIAGRCSLWLRTSYTGLEALPDDRAPLSWTPGLYDPGDRPVLVERLDPGIRLCIVGAVHIAQELCHITDRAGYDVIIIDPRSAWAKAERFPGRNVVCHWPDEALDAIGCDPHSAVITLSHTPMIDDPALLTALRGTYFYIAALGSRRTHNDRIRRLTDAGARGLERIHAPAGLAINARGAFEIAISIVAGMVECYHQACASLRNPPG